MMRRPLHGRTRRSALALLLAALLAGGVAEARAASAAGSDSGTTPTAAPAATTPADAGAPATTTPAATTPATTPADAPPAPTPTTGADAPAPSPPPATTPPAPAPPAGAATPARSSTTASTRAHASRSRRPVARIAGVGTVTIKDFSFGPTALTVHVGDTVTWSNAGPSDHTATGSGFDTGVLHTGKLGSHTFTVAGSFNYHCSIHPFMKGTVTVLASTASAGSSGSSAPTTGSGSGVSTTSAAPASGSTLPHTGLDVLALAALGGLLLALGLLLRRRTAGR